MNKKLEILRNKLLLVEGKDAYNFFIWGLERMSIEDVQVMDFGGINDLNKFLLSLKAMDKFDSIETIVIARDAENDYVAAEKSIKQCMQTHFSIFPINAFSFIKNKIKLAYMLFPGFDEGNVLQNGTLEDLCLSTLDNERKETSNEFIDKINERFSFSHLHKTKVHSYLAISDKFVGCKIGEAAKAGAWNWKHKKLEPYFNIINSM